MTGRQLYGVTVTVDCNPGFGIAFGGNRFRTCSGDGSSTTGNWTGSPPLCIGLSLSEYSIDVIYNITLGQAEPKANYNAAM